MQHNIRVSINKLVPEQRCIYILTILKLVLIHMGPIQTLKRITQQGHK